MDDDVIAVDFDGVLNSYASGWTSADDLPDDPVPGAIEWLEQMTSEFDVVIFTCRALTPGADDAIAQWLTWHGLSPAAFQRLRITAEKPHALIYFDDRAWRCEGPGSYPTADEIRQFRPWMKR